MLLNSLELEFEDDCRSLCDAGNRTRTSARAECS